MVSVDRVTNRTKLGSIAATAASLVLIGILAGCSAPVEDAGSSVTLAQSKSPVQLLRNETASRLPTGAIESLGKSTDLSVACLSEEQDPKGLMRKWTSTSVVMIEKASQWRTSKIAKDLVQTLVDDGWTARDAGGSASIQSSLLTRGVSLAEIQITSKVPSESAPSTPEGEVVTDFRIEIETHGPCVATDGPESDEVTRLEASS